MTDETTADVSASGFALAAVSILVASACLVNCVAMAVVPALVGEPLPWGELVMAGIVGTVSGVVVAVALRARRKGSTGDARSALLVRGVPLLLALGTVVGVVVAQGLVRAAVDVAAARDAYSCARFEALGPIQAEACTTTARACRHETRNGPGLAAPARRGVNAEPLSPLAAALALDTASSDRRRAQLVCMAKRQAAFGGAAPTP